MSLDDDKRLWVLPIIMLICGVLLLSFTTKTDEDILQPEMFVYQTAYLSQYHDMMFEIVPCEGGWKDDAQNPVSTAYGACQFLDGTWDYVQTKWNMELDRNSYYDQLYACDRLLCTEGLRHWYASSACWN